MDEFITDAGRGLFFTFATASLLVWFLVWYAGIYEAYLRIRGCYQLDWLQLRSGLSRAELEEIIGPRSEEQVYRLTKEVLCRVPRDPWRSYLVQGPVHPVLNPLFTILLAAALLAWGFDDGFVWRCFVVFGAYAGLCVCWILAAIPFLIGKRDVLVEAEEDGEASDYIVDLLAAANAELHAAEKSIELPQPLKWIHLSYLEFQRAKLEKEKLLWERRLAWAQTQLEDCWREQLDPEANHEILSAIELSALFLKDLAHDQLVEKPFRNFDDEALEKLDKALDESDSCKDEDDEENNEQ